MSFATPADLIARKDVRTLGDLASDSGTRLTSVQLATDTNLQAALDDAAGEMLGALLQGERYTRSNLDNLTAESKAYLKAINCDLAFWRLWERRPAYDDDPQRDAARDRAKKHLEMLRSGQYVFDVDGAKEAGLPSIVGPSRVQINDLNLIVDQARGKYYPARLTPHNR